VFRPFLRLKKQSDANTRLNFDIVNVFSDGCSFTLVAATDKMNYDILIFNIAVFVAAIFLLDYGADKFIDHTAVVASRLGVSQTLVALLTAGAEWEEVCESLQYRINYLPYLSSPW